MTQKIIIALFIILIFSPNAFARQSEACIAGMGLPPKVIKSSSRLRVVVAKLFGADIPSSEFGDAASVRMQKLLTEYLAKKSLGVEHVEVIQLSCSIESKEQASNISKQIEADILIWGQTFIDKQPSLQDIVKPSGSDLATPKYSITSTKNKIQVGPGSYVQTGVITNISMKEQIGQICPGIVFTARQFLEVVKEDCISVRNPYLLAERSLIDLLPAKLRESIDIAVSLYLYKNGSVELAIKLLGESLSSDPILVANSTDLTMSLLLGRTLIEKPATREMGKNYLQNALKIWPLSDQVGKLEHLCKIGIAFINAGDVEQGAKFLQEYIFNYAATSQPDYIKIIALEWLLRAKKYPFFERRRKYDVTLSSGNQNCQGLHLTGIVSGSDLERFGLQNNDTIMYYNNQCLAAPEISFCTNAPQSIVLLNRTERMWIMNINYGMLLIDPEATALLWQRQK